MTEKVNPSQGRPAEAFKTAGAIGYAGGSSAGDRSGFITETPSEISQVDPDVDETALNSFAQTSSGTSLDVTIDPGEAFVGGAWLCIDTSTTVSLQSSTIGQTVFVGWDQTATNDVVVGRDAAFATSSTDTDFRIPLFEFDTDGSGVTSVTDRRQIGQRIDPSAARVSDELGVPLYANTTNAPQQQGNVVVVDGSGTQAAGLYSHNGTSYVKAGNTDESVQDIVAGLLTAGTDISLNYDDANDTLTVNNTGGYTDEEARDAIAAALVAGTNIGVTQDDANNEITIDTSALDAEQVQDEVDALIAGGSNITTTYDDVNGALTIDTSALNSEQVQDEVNTLLSSGSDINLTYDDANNTLLIEGTSAGSFFDGNSDGVAELESSLNGVQLQDDTTIVFGTDSDMSVEYDSTNDDLRWRDNTNTTDRMSLDRGTGDVTITGTFTENASL